MNKIFQQYYLLLFCLLLLYGNICAQGKSSGKIVMNKKQLFEKIRVANNDSSKIKALIMMGLSLHASETERYHKIAGKEYIMQAVSLAKWMQKYSSIGYFIDSIGVEKRRNGEYTTSLRLHQIALNIGQNQKDKKLMTIAYNNIGVVYRRIDNYRKALDNHLKALRLAEEINDSTSMAMAINSIGNVEIMLGDYTKSLKYFRQSLRLERNRKNLIGIAINLNNIGNVYHEKKLYTKAIEYYRLSLDVNKKIDSHIGIAICYSDLAEAYRKRGSYKTAITYLNKALEINKKDNYKLQTANNYLLLGEVYARLREYSKAKKILISGNKLSKQLGIKTNIEKTYRALYFISKHQHQYKKALEYLEITNVYHDSVMNINIRKDVARLQIEFETERKENKIALLTQQAKIRNLNLNKQKFLTYFLLFAFVFALLIVAWLSVYLYNKNKLNRLLTEKNREIERTRRQLEKNTKELQKAKQKAERSNLSKTEFLANMSHEIRTPLNSVIGFSDLLAKFTDDPKQKSYLKSIKSSGESLLSLINDILDLSKIEAGKVEIKPEPVNIKRILEDVQQIFSVRAAEKNLTLTVKIDPDLPQKVLFSKTRLRQILFNLVGNALKFTSTGGITLTAVCEHTSQRNKINLTISVKDSGKGISPEEQQLIFSPFYQSRRNDQEQGTGLGLAITERLIKALGGKITLKSILNTGSVFTLTFDNLETLQSTKTKNLYRETEKWKINILLLNAGNEIFEKLETFLKTQVVNFVKCNTSLACAKKEIMHCHLVITNGLTGEMLNNTIKVLTTEKPKIPFIVIGPENSTEMSNFNIVFVDENLPFIDILKILEKEFKKVDYAKQKFDMFETESNPQLFAEAIKHIETIYNNEFDKAIQTKLLQNISTFAQKLSTLAQHYHMPYLNEYTAELQTLITEFDIVGIDEKLQLFEEAYQQSLKK